MLLGGTGDDQLDGGDGNDFLVGGPGADFLDGGTGIDTLDYTASVGGVSVSLAANGGSIGDAEGDTIQGIENVTGSNFGDGLEGDGGANVLNGKGGDDLIRGGGGNDVVAGGFGADQLEGGAGIDTLDYRGSAEAVAVGLNGHSASGGDATGDRITGFENVIGSAQDDVLVGDDSANRLSGGAGADLIVGLGGNDVVAGGSGADHLDGGNGIDTLDYGGSAAAVFVDLAGGQASGGDAQGDTITGFENLIGSAQADGLVGDGGANRLSGGGGGDFLFGGLGRDELTGGTGNDVFAFSSTTESGTTAATRDVVHDFHHGEGDKLLLEIDADAGKPGIQELTFIGSKAFTAPGQVRSFLEGDHTVVEVNTAGHSGAEMQLQLDHHVTLAASDFMFAS